MCLGKVESVVDRRREKAGSRLRLRARAGGKTGDGGQASGVGERA